MRMMMALTMMMVMAMMALKTMVMTALMMVVETRFQGNSCRPCALDENNDGFDDDDGGDEFLHFHSKIKKTELVCPPTKK